jgi:hypothetical protein
VGVQPAFRIYGEHGDQWFAPFVSGEFTLSPQQVYEIPSISLSVASANTEVTVRPTEVIAAEQIRAEEKQRLLGVFPNFYVSYARDAAPLTTEVLARDTRHVGLDLVDRHQPNGRHRAGE